MTNKVVILNGPPSSGKDETADFVCRNSFKFEKGQFKEPIYEIGAAIYGITYGTMVSYCTNREYKEKPMDLFEGLSPRNALIKVSEEAIKPAYGKDYFGKRAAKAFMKYSNYIFADGGFKEEAQGIIEKVGKENLIVIRIERPGCSFDNDSRYYLEQDMLPGVEFIDVKNDGNFDEFKTEVFNILQMRGLT